MLRIATHIECLLPMHDCVIISGVGGFVLQTLPAAYRKEDHTFLPMRKEIVFNESLRHNDGLLPESYMQVYGTDYQKAQGMVEEDIAELQASLRQYGKVSLGKTGSLSLGKENQLVYQPGKTDVFDADCYGLSSFAFPVLPPAMIVTEDEQPARRKDVFYIPVSKRFVRGSVAAAAAIALFLLSPLPVNDMKQPAYTAGVLPSTILPKATTAPEILPTVEAKSNTAAETAKPNVAPPLPSPTLSQPAKGKTFHIIIGSFPSKGEADRFMTRIDRAKYAGAGVVFRKDRYRVYAGRYSNRQEAEARLAAIRKNAKYKDAWLFIGRN
ncbi:Sporulation related domain protein [Bacteroidales bacterium Barb6]|nr:Sporulation related domain protein [Bacteroidales bacterium Barb6]